MSIEQWTVLDVGNAASGSFIIQNFVFVIRVGVFSHLHQ